MEYDYYPVKRHVDTHNRIWGGKIWCIQVGSHNSLNSICAQLCLTSLDISGYLRDYLRCHDVVPYRLCRVRRDESYAPAQPFPDLQNYQHDRVQLRNLLGGLKSPEVNVFRPRSCAKGQRN